MAFTPKAGNCSADNHSIKKHATSYFDMIEHRLSERAGHNQAKASHYFKGLVQKITVSVNQSITYTWTNTNRVKSLC